VFIKDRSLQFIYVDRAFADGLGHAPADLVGKSDLEFTSREFADSWQAEDRTVMESGRPMDRVEEHTDRFGITRRVRFVEVPLRDEDGEVRGVLGRWDSLADAQQPAEGSNPRQPAEFHTTLNPDGTVLEWNLGRVGDGYVYEPWDVLGRPLTCLAQPMARAGVRAALARAVSGEWVSGLGVNFVGRQGYVEHLSLSLEPVAGPDGEVTAVRADALPGPLPEPVPVADPPAVPGAPSLLDRVPDAVYRADPGAGRFAYVCPWADLVFGFSAEQISEMTWPAFCKRVHPDDAEAVADATARLTAAPPPGGAARLAYRFRRSDGSYVALVEDRIATRPPGVRSPTVVGVVWLTAGDPAEGRALRLPPSCEGMHAGPDIHVALKDMDLRFVWCDEPYVFCVPRAERVGRPDSDVVPAETAARYAAEDRAFIEHARAVPLALGAMLSPTREQVKVAVLSRRGEMVGIVIVTAPVAAREPDSILPHWAAVVTATDDAVIGLDHASRIVGWNPGAERLYGYSEPEVQGMFATFLAPDDTREDLRRRIERVTRGESVRNWEVVHVTKDARPVTVSLTMSPLRVAGDIVTGAAIIARDVTENRRAEDALRESEERFRRVVETVSDGISICEWDSGSSRRRLVFCNERFVEMSGFPHEELQRARDLDSLLVWLDSGEHRRHRRERLLAGLPVTGLASWKRPDGAANVMERSAVAVRTGRAYRVYCVDRDVTDRLNTENALRQSEERFGRLVAAAFDGISICRWDPVRDTRRLISCNDRLVEMSGYTRGELQHAADLGELQVVHESAAQAKDRFVRMLKELPCRGRASWRRPDGRANAHEFSAVTMKMGDEHHLLSVDRDVTERAEEGKGSAR
jgi:PAS domain S-box-containing protein